MICLGVIPIIAVAEPLTFLHRHGMFLANSNHAVYDRVINMLIGPLLTTAVILSVVLAARWFDHRPLAHFSVILDIRWLRNLAAGAAVGTLAMITIFMF